MTLKRIEKLLEILRANNVAHFKSSDIEIRIGEVPHLFHPKAHPVPTTVSTNGVPQTMPAAVAPTTPAAGAPSNSGDIRPSKIEIPHHINEVKRILKLSPEELVDELFPDGSSQQQAAE